MLLTQTNHILDWLAESESNFLGHAIGIIWTVNKCIQLWPNYPSFIAME